MTYRRETLISGSLGILWGAVCGCGAEAAPSGAGQIFGCTLPDRAAKRFFDRASDSRMFITGDEPMIPRSGDKYFDLALAQSLAMISELFRVTPGFAYYDDYDGHNAYATPKARLNGSDGTVLFGQGMLERLRKSPESPEITVVSVCAHEFGHIVQFRHRLVDKVNAGQSTTRRSELQADFFSGYFAGMRKRLKPSYPAAVFAMTQYGFGDNMVNKPSHHGTPEERAAAIIRGYETSFRDNKPFAEAIGLSVNYALSL